MPPTTIIGSRRPQIAWRRIAHRSAHEAGAWLYYDVNFRKNYIADLPDLMPNIEENMRLANVVRGSTEDFEYLFPGKLKKPAADETAPELPAEKPQDAQESTVKDIDKPAAPVYIGLREQLSELNAEQLEIISAIEGDDTHIDELIERTGMSTAKVLAQLTILEIKGYVRRSAGRRISLNIKSK